ncbi:TonB-dependent receptor plug domain-containing protein [Puniceicoccaceae bacterium K14]|nr:TonB-dependent receptor plug domain-containing protein [Puniceicoccaceae bacterium K14]
MKKVINKRNLGLIAMGLPLLTPYTYAQEEEDEAFELSPFEVNAEDDSRYRATSTLAGTRLRTDLRDIGSAISVVTEEFLEDTGATNNESLLLYTLGTEVGGSAGNFAGGGDGGRVDTDDQRRNPSAANRVRGLAAADSTRNFYATDIPWDSFNVNRVDIQRGPNSVLFGLGSPAGVINAGLKTAMFSDQGEVGLNFGNDDSWRATLDYNKVIIEDELSVRLSVLESEKGFQQEEAFEDDSRIFLSAQWAPSFLNTDSSKGKLTANYEDGEIMANRPRVLPPIDRITPWFNSANGDLYQGTFTAPELQTFSQSGATGSEFIGIEVLGRIFNGPVAFYDGSGTPSAYRMAAVDGINYLGIDDASDAAAKAGLPFSSIGGVKSKTLSDASIFDFYNHMLDGDNKREWQEWDSYNITYEHTWLNDSLGIEVGFDSQSYQEGQVNVLDNWGQSISVDIVSVFPDGSENPNVGRAIVGGETQNNRNDSTDRDTFRATGFYEFDFRDLDNDSLGFLGSHLFTALYSDQEVSRLDTEWVRNTSLGIDSGSIDGASRYLSNIVYVSDDLSGLSSASGANIQPISYRLIPHDTEQTIVTSAGVVSPFSVLSYDNGDIASLYKQADKSKDEIESTALIWQGKMFDDLFVPMFALRKDSVDAANAGNAPDGPETGSVNPFGEDWNLPGSAADADASTVGATYNSVSETTRTYGAVIHAPQSITDALGGTQLSLSYANSENFSPDASRRGIDGAAVPNQTGETEEFGLTISALKGKLQFKVNRYETTVKNATLSGSSIANSYMIGFGEGVARWAALQTRKGNYGFSTNYALDANGNQINPDIEVLRYEPIVADSDAGATAQEVEDAYNRQEAILAHFVELDSNGEWALIDENRPSAAIESFWGQNYDAITGDDTWGGPDQANAWAGEPTNFAVTSDFISKGTEFELFYQPTENWNIMLNAAKIDAQRFNIAESYATYVNERWDLYKNTEYGDIKLFNGFNADPESLEFKYGAEFHANYLANVLINRSNVPELREWRANFITNYSFTEGKFKGLNVGGAIRWQDEVTTGFAGTLATEAIEEFSIDVGDEIYDVSNPYTGPSETNYDLWASYSAKISDNIDWKIQLNISNVFADDELIPVTVDYDGTVATSRIAPQRTWTISNTFSF